jgi:hypothetical protein
VTQPGGAPPACSTPFEGIGLWYVAEVPHAPQVWRHRPATAVPLWAGQGRTPTRTRVLAGEAPLEEGGQVAAALPADHWPPPTLPEGSNGPLVAHFAALRVIAVRGGLPGPGVWLVGRRHRLPGALQTSLRNAPSALPLAPLVRLSGMRWPIETGCEDGQQSLGMGEYEGRSWRGWHHHMTLCILAHCFLVRACLRLKKKAPGLTVPQGQGLLCHVLPARSFDAQMGLDLIASWQRRNHAAYVSHRKRRIALHSQRECSFAVVLGEPFCLRRL